MLNLHFCRVRLRTASGTFSSSPLFGGIVHSLLFARKQTHMANPVRNPAVAARVDLVKAGVPLPDATVEAVKRICAITGQAAEELTATIEGTKAYDIGRLIAALDQLQQAKNTACDAINLPHHLKK
jgi:hypothetical protein